MLGRHADAQPAGGSEGLMEIGGKTALSVALQPVGVGEAGADARDGLRDLLLLGAQREIHGAVPPRAYHHAGASGAREREMR